MPTLHARSRNSKRQKSQQALVVALVYAVFASLWILLSDRLVGLWLHDPEQMVAVSTVKGWLFVACTSILLYLLVWRLTPAHPGRASHPPATWRIPWPWMALVVLGTLLLSAWMVHNHYQNARQTAQTRLLALAHTQAEQLDLWLQERQADLTLLQASVALKQHWQTWLQSSNSDSAAVILERLQRYAGHGHFQQGAVMASDGRALWIPNPSNAAPRLEPWQQQAVQLALRHGTIQQIGPWKSAQGQLQLALVAPLTLPDPTPPSVVLLQIELPAFVQRGLSVRPQATGSMQSLLLRRNGNHVEVLSDLPDNPPGSPDSAMLSLEQTEFLWVRALDGKTAPPGTLLEGVDHRGVTVLGLAEPILHSDWWLLVQQDRAALIADTAVEALRNVLIIVLTLFATAVGIYLYVQRQRLRHTQAHIDDLQRVQARLSESEARYRLLAENGNDVIWLFDLKVFKTLYISPSVQRLLNLDAETAKLRPLETLLSPVSMEMVRNELPQRLAAFSRGEDSQRTRTHEIWFVHQDGHLVPTEMASTLVANEQGAAIQAMAVIRDISARKAAEAQITRLSQAMEQSPASVIITDLNIKIEYVNPAFELISGYTREEVIGRNPRFLQSGKTPRGTYTSMWSTLRAGKTWSGELVNRHKTGREYLQSVTVAPVRNEQGEVTHFLSVQLDVTAQRDAETKVHQLAWFDPLTNLPNRQHLIADLNDALAASRRSDHPTQSVLLLLNLDRFKTINDALGHSAGDTLIQRVSERLTQTGLHPGDTLARMGADEFALLMHDRRTQSANSAHEALELCQTLHNALAAPFVLADGRSINIAASIGVTLLPHQDNDQAGDVLRRVNTALHRAKRSGGHQTAFFDATMGQVVSERFALEQDLRRGLAAGELRLFLQPQVNYAGQIISAEALVRRNHPEQGLLPPGLFIPLAEESDLILQLGHWVLQEVCQHLGELHRQQSRLPVAVNISPRQFHQPTFVADLLQLLEQTGAQAGDLILEITESVVLEQVDDVIARMNELTRHGIRFSIDDFGTGYSALSYLRRLPIHELKIDRSFVQDAPRDPNGAALVEAILSVARHLRLRVVAEGVETTAQAQFFAEYPEVLFQGYLFGRPEPAQALLSRWLSGQTTSAPVSDTAQE